MHLYTCSQISTGVLLAVPTEYRRCHVPLLKVNGTITFAMLPCTRCLFNVLFVSTLDIIGVAITPADFTVPENLITQDNPMVIECAFTCIVCSGATLEWSYIGGPIPDGVTIVTSPVGRTIDLEIVQGSPDQSGTYVCSAVMNDGTVAHSVEVNVSILVMAECLDPRSKQESATGRIGHLQVPVFTSSNLWLEF